MIIQPRLRKQKSLDPDPVLANNSWAQIEKAIQDDVAKILWNVGDTIDIKLTGNHAQTLTLEILGFGHDDLIDGGKASITFGCKNLASGEEQMNTTSTNAGGYGVTNMHTAVLPEYLDSFPKDLKSLIKTVNKNTSKGNQSTEIEEIPCKLFLFSGSEMFDENTPHASFVKGEGVKYSKFTDDASRIKTRNGIARNYWLRSPVYYSNGFCCITNTGSYTSNPAGGYLYVAFGFCI